MSRDNSHPDAHNPQSDQPSTSEQLHTIRDPLRETSLWDVCETIRTVVSGFPTVQRVYLVGPVAGLGSTRSASEIDIAIEGHLGSEDYILLLQALEEVVASWQIDLVELARDLHVAARVRERGLMIYERMSGEQ
jgi:predicted nucleotidyltransferase